MMFENNVNAREEIFNDIVEIIKDIIHVEEVIGGDNIFLLGGESLQAINIANIISEKYGLEFKFNLFLKLKNVDGIVDYIADYIRADDVTVI